MDKQLSVGRQVCEEVREMEEQIQEEEVNAFIFCRGSRIAWAVEGVYALGREGVRADIASQRDPGVGREGGASGRPGLGCVYFPTQ